MFSAISCLNIIESQNESQNGLGWKVPQISSSFNLPAMGRVTSHYTRLPRATASLALSASRDGASTTSLGNLFQCITTPWVKKSLLISNLNLPCLSFKPFPLVLSLSTHVNSHFYSQKDPLYSAPALFTKSSIVLNYTLSCFSMRNFCNKTFALF